LFDKNIEQKMCFAKFFLLIIAGFGFFMFIKIVQSLNWLKQT